jgi:hypothetical protein
MDWETNQPLLLPRPPPISRVSTYPSQPYEPPPILTPPAKPSCKPTVPTHLKFASSTSGTSSPTVLHSTSQHPQAFKNTPTSALQPNPVSPSVGSADALDTVSRTRTPHWNASRDLSCSLHRHRDYSTDENKTHGAPTWDRRPGTELRASWGRWGGDRKPESK